MIWIVIHNWRTIRCKVGMKHNNQGIAPHTASKVKNVINEIQEKT
jgi:hypothetical protein